MDRSHSDEFRFLLRRLRRDAGLTQVKLANLAKIGRRTVQDLERGINQPSTRSLHALADALRLRGYEAVAFYAAATSTCSISPDAGDSAGSGGQPPTASSLHFDIRAELPRNVSAPPSRFVGRKREVNQLCAYLRADSGRAAAICGISGLGKTALAEQVVYELARDRSAFAGGLTRIEGLGQGGSDSLIWVYERLLADWHIEVPPDARNARLPADARLAEYERALRERFQRLVGPVLVFLDNVERVFPLSRLLAQMRSLGACLLITSQHQPRLSDLREWSLDELEPASAVELFVNHYVKNGGRWDSARDMDVTRDLITAELGYLPLAIELAAVRAAILHMGVTGLVAEIQRDALDAAHHPSDPVQRVRLRLARNLEPLRPEERTRFAALGLPQGTDWPVPVVEALLAAVPHQQAEGAGSARKNLEHIESLSLVKIVPGSARGEGRVRMHTLLRALAADEWRKQPKKVREAAVLGLIAGVLEWLNTEHGWSGGDPRTVIAQADWPLVVGMVQRALTERSPLLAAQEQGELAFTVETMDKLETLSWYLAASDSTHAYLQKWLDTARNQGLREDEARALAALGFLHHVSRDFDHARAHYERALTIVRGAGDQHFQAGMLFDLGDVAIAKRDLAEARSKLDEGLKLAIRLRDQTVHCFILLDFSEIARIERNFEGAQLYLDQAKAVNDALGSRHRAADILAATAALELTRGDTARAKQLFAQVEAAFAAIGRDSGYFTRRTAEDVGRTDDQTS